MVITFIWSFESLIFQYFSIEKSFFGFAGQTQRKNMIWTIGSRKSTIELNKKVIDGFLIS